MTIVDSIGSALAASREERRSKKVLKEQNLRRQELHCHACDKYVQFTLDMALNGNHVLECPNCGHEHCRVVEDGEITADRWAQRNGNAGLIYQIRNAVCTGSSTYTSGQSYANYVLWMDTSTSS